MLSYNVHIYYILKCHHTQRRACKAVDLQLRIMLPVDICAVTVQQLLACWNQTIWTRCTWRQWLGEDGRGGETVKFHSAIHVHNEATSCIPAKLCKWGMAGINSAEDSGPVSLASNALNGFGPIIVCLRAPEWGLNIPRPRNDNARPKLTHLHGLSACSCTGKQELYFLSGRKKD